MTKYVFKVYTEDNANNVNIEELQQAELIDMDKYAIKSGSYMDLSQILAKKLKIEQHNIKRIVILNIRKGLEFSIAINNKYLKNLLLDVEEKNQITKSKHYSEMKDYLFQNLESNNYKDFLNNVYTYENKFRMLLTNYSNAYSQGTYTEEERLNVSHLRQEVEKKLSEYKNYRGLCICRQKSEERTSYYGKQKPSLSIMLTPTIMTTAKYKLKPQYFPTVEEETEKYNRDNEEFLDPEEYLMMQGDSESEVDEIPKSY